MNDEYKSGTLRSNANKIKPMHYPIGRDPMVEARNTGKASLWFLF